MGVNRGRVFLGGLLGGVVWNVWSVAVQFLIIGMARYQAAQNSGQFLKEPRYPAFRPNTGSPSPISRNGSVSEPLNRWRSAGYSLARH